MCKPAIELFILHLVGWTYIKVYNGESRNWIGRIFSDEPDPSKMIE